MITRKHIKDAHCDIDKIFRTILPGYGMNEREEQIKLSHNMLDAMITGSIALSDAGTGIGKTYSYLVAGIVFDRLRRQIGLERKPIVVSTASVALQKEVNEEYIPFLSNALIQAGFITEPVCSVIRKGKGRYVCDARLKRRLRCIDADKKNKRNMDALMFLTKHIDMDEAQHLSGFDRRQVSVPKVCDCSEMGCRYTRFAKDACGGKYLFQICNHNIMLADAIHKRYHMTPIIPEYCALVLDEGHKLPAAARQMFGRTLGENDVKTLAFGLKNDHYPLAAQNLIISMRPILDGIAETDDEKIAEFEENRDRLIKDALKTLESIKQQIGHELTRQTYMDLGRMITTLSLFTDEESDIILYTDTDEHDRPVLCASAGDLSEQMQMTLWDTDMPIIITSGTLAVGEDFTRFKAEACLAGAERKPVESVSLSPFDYENHCVLYVPYDAPRYDENNMGAYYDALANEIAELINTSCGHALVLFNSYSAMSAIQKRCEQCSVTQPVFTLSRNAKHVLNAFRESSNGILLATGAAWEGFDFPGDMVSMLIIPRLPFPIPDAFSEHQKEQCRTLSEFIRSVAVPDMQIKLRQGFGRAIRLETDTCAVAILDERALRYKRYHKAVKQALPDIPMTGSVRSVERFLRSVKDESYFSEVK